MIFRLYYQQLGGHVHCRLFAGTHNGALGNCGNFVMREEEFAEFKKYWPWETREEPLTDLSFSDMSGSGGLV